MRIPFLVSELKIVSVPFLVAAVFARSFVVNSLLRGWWRGRLGRLGLLGRTAVWREYAQPKFLADGGVGRVALGPLQAGGVLNGDQPVVKVVGAAVAFA